MSENYPTSKDMSNEVLQWMDRLRGRTVAQIIEMIGKPFEEFGPSREERASGGRREAVLFARALVFADVGKTFDRLAVYERANGDLEFRFKARKLAGDAA